MMENSLVVLKRKSLINQIIDLCLIIVTLIAVLILTICMIIIVKKIINPDKVPDVLGIKPFIVLTGSMEPTVRIGDMAIIKEINPENLKVGDIIAFRNTEEKTITLHRITEIDRSETNVTFRTKGDNNQAEDKASVRFSEVEGVFFKKVSGLGKVAMFIRTPLGVTCSILFIVMIFLVWQIVKLRQTERLLIRRIIEYRKTIENFTKE